MKIGPLEVFWHREWWDEFSREWNGLVTLLAISVYAALGSMIPSVFFTSFKDEVIDWPIVWLVFLVVGVVVFLATKHELKMPLRGA